MPYSRFSSRHYCRKQTSSEVESISTCAPALPHAADTISRVDLKLVDDIQSQDKPCIFVVNKWDLGLEQGMTAEKWADYLAKTFSMMKYVSVAFVTAKDSRNIKQLVNLAQSVFKQSRTRVSTPRLNKALQKAIERNPPSSKKGKRLKIFYATQISTQPPTIVVKTNDPTLLDEGWKRYLLGAIREQLPYKEIPIRLYFRGRSEKDDPDEKPKKQKRGGKKIASRKARRSTKAASDKTSSE